MHGSDDLRDSMRFACLGAQERRRLEQVLELMTVHEDAASHSEHYEWKAQHQRYPQMDLAQYAARASIPTYTPLGSGVNARLVTHRPGSQLEPPKRF